MHVDHGPRPPLASGNDRAELGELPRFELVWRFDDPGDPSEVTVFPSDGGDDVTTTWLTVDTRHAVPLPEVR